MRMRKLNILLALMVTVRLTVFVSEAGATSIAQSVPIDEMGEWTYITRGGAIAMKARFNKAKEFSEGRAAVAQGQRRNPYEMFLIDRRGSLVFKLCFYSIDSFHDGKAVVRMWQQKEPDFWASNLPSDKETYLLRGGELINRTFKRCGPNENGYSVVTTLSNSGEELKGLLGSDGEIALPKNYKILSNVSEGRIAV